MDNFDIIKSLTQENEVLKKQLSDVIAELNNLKNQINESKQKTKQYYENNKEKIIARVKEYNKNNNYKSNVTSEKKKEYNKIAYLKKKEKEMLKNEN